MKDQLKRIISGVPVLEKIMFTYFALRFANTVAAESARRKEISLFDFGSLSQEIPFGPEERVIDNNLYGHMHHMKSYANFTKDSKSYLEHGLFWGGMVHKDTQHWHYKKVITFSENRKNDIEAVTTDKTAYSIGPYIHYASSLYSDKKMAQLKAELGKVLLVFPSHSVKHLAANYDFNLFITEINRLKKGFDTVLVSLYFIDALDTNTVKIYQSKGYKIVTSGHKFDQNFIARQRTIIELADMTMSNEMGTHVGYCTLLNKPHYIYHQSVDRTKNNPSEAKRHAALISDNQLLLTKEQQKEVQNLFSIYSSEEITKEQKAIVNKYWGTQSLKSPKELAHILAI